MNTQYPESPQQAAEYIRLALPLMARNGIPATPRHYTVWYDYVSGRNQALKDSIDRLLAGERGLTVELSDALYDTHVRTGEEQLIERLRAEVRALVTAVLQRLADSGGQADHYGAVLESYHERLTRELGCDEFQHLLTEFTVETRTMLEANRRLEQQLQSTNQELDELRRQLETARQEASTDALTDLANRKAFDAALEARCAAAAQQTRLCLIMADIDHFKRFNDNHGHLVGDKLLRFVAQTLKDAVKGQDLVARFGGEEFVILLPDTPLRGAAVVAESLRVRVQSQRLRRTDNQRPLGGVTLSLGVACLHAGDTADTLVARADAALYQSKRLGRNRVTLETQIPPA